MRAIASVIYLNMDDGDIDDEYVMSVRESLIHWLDANDFDGFQMAAVKVYGLDADESVEFVIEDHDDLDEEDDIDDLRCV